jgi:hypothetical protein
MKGGRHQDDTAVRLRKGRPMITTSTRASFATRIILAICVLSAPGEVRAQDAAALEPTAEIPRDYSSWSLFLVCNPAWMIENGDKGIAELFTEYREFGRSIGNKHLAIWFWKRRASVPTGDNTDVERSSAYCERYKLLPSESPHVLVTTRHPDDPDPGDRFVVRLNGLAAHDSALALTKLADQLLVTKLNQSELDAQQKGWSRVLDALYLAISTTGCYFNKVSFSLKTGVVSAEIEHLPDNTRAGSRC